MKKMTTDRLIIRPFQSSDWEDLFEYLSSEDVCKYEPYDAYTKEACVEEAYKRATGEVDGFWAVCTANTMKMIGHIYFVQSDPAEFRTWELGYVFNPNFYGQGYATEASMRILQYGFMEKGAHRIVAGVNVKNEASWKVLERLKMRREAHLLQNVFFKRTLKGEPIWNDSFRYGILSDEFMKQREETNASSFNM